MSEMQTEVAALPAAEKRDGSLWRAFIADFRRSKTAVLGLVVFSLVVLGAIFAPLIAPQNPYDLMQLNILDGRLPPGSASMDGMTFWLGTDDKGRDMLSGILYGLRISLVVGVGSAFLAAIIGTAQHAGRPGRRRCQRQRQCQHPCRPAGTQGDRHHRQKRLFSMSLPMSSMFLPLSFFFEPASVAPAPASSPTACSRAMPGADSRHNCAWPDCMIDV